MFLRFHKRTLHNDLSGLYKLSTPSHCRRNSLINNCVPDGSAAIVFEFIRSLLQKCVVLLYENRILLRQVSISFEVALVGCN